MWQPEDPYNQKKTVAVPAKNPNAAKKQQALASNFLGHDATRFYEKPVDQKQIIDIDLAGLPKDFDDKKVKEVA